MNDTKKCCKKACCIKKMLGLMAVAAIAFFIGAKCPCNAKDNTAAAVAGAYKVGDVVPATSFADITGKTHNLADFKGKIVVLEWTNPNCPFVKKFYDKGDMPRIQSENLAKGKVVWIAINSSAEGKEGYFADNAQAQKIVAEKAFKGTAYVRDPSGALGKQFGAKTTPHMFVIDADGKLAYQGAIDSVKSFDQADIAKATNYVSAAIDALLAGKAVETASTESYGCSVKY
jgi:peroxiredoxin